MVCNLVMYTYRKRSRRGVTVDACAVDPLLTLTLINLPQYEAMASVLGKIGLMLFGLVMVVLGGMIALLMIVWEMITHPFTVFKKVSRNGELFSDLWTHPNEHPLAQYIIYTLSHGPACSDSLGDGALVYKQY